MSRLKRKYKRRYARVSAWLCATAKPRLVKIERGGFVLPKEVTLPLRV